MSKLSDASEEFNNARENSTNSPNSHDECETPFLASTSNQIQKQKTKMQRPLVMQGKHDLNAIGYVNEMHNVAPHLLTYPENEILEEIDDFDKRLDKEDANVVFVNGNHSNDSDVVQEALFYNRKQYLNPDIAAMSVLSLVEKEDDLENKMDTNQDFESPSVPVPVQNIKMHELVDNVQESLSHSSPGKSLDRDDSECGCIAQAKCPKPSIYFNDGIRSVDFILVWDQQEIQAISQAAFARRSCFEANLIKEGLELEYEPPEKSGLCFIKVHAPREVLRRYSEILKLRMPMKEILGQELTHRGNFIIDGFRTQWEKVKDWVLVDKEHFPEKGHRFTAIYSRDREYLFDVDSPCFFTPAIHSRIVQFILDRQMFSKTNDDFAFGIERLLNENTYTAVYPLHDGDYRLPGSMRNLLYTEWAAIRKWYRYQPLDYVREYFGVKIALYFAWLGFYTHMLIPAAVVGLACFVYSWATLYSNKPSEDICNSTIKMCPLCDHWCDYWDLKETCVHARITYLFDNSTTVFFAIFMSFWATLFLELWKRYSAEITHRWDLTGFDIQEEHPRPQYLARLSHVKRRQMNVVTNTMEPYVPFWRMKFPATILSFSVVILLVAMALATVVAVVLYRMSVLTALRVYGDRVTTSSAILFTTSTAASINLCCIIVFNWLYTYVAEYLTELELLRTQTEFDDSLTLKIYLLQFVNYYASIFYIAFFKGKLIGSPRRYNRLFGYRQEECGPGGCLMELCIQLAIIMIGKQAMNTVLEMLFPLFYKWLNTVKVKTGLQKDESSKKGTQPQWVRDFKLVEWGPRSLFPEYLEMVLQYGFVTIFVAAFPLAPFFALLNNILEMRLDAQKILTFHRRPVTQRVRDIGVWYRILDSIGKLSVVTNGFIIAFTSDFIPRLVYRLAVSDDYSLNGYLNNTLSYFNTSDFQVASVPRHSVFNETICRYPDYREPPGHEHSYDLNAMFWHILAARLAFVVVFENVVAIVMIMVRWCIPDVPKDLRAQIRREVFITNEIIIKQETLRAQSGDSVLRKERATILKSCPSSQAQWDRFVSKSLTEAEFDLMMHENLTPVDNSGIIKPPTSV
ncbi:anoctamin-5 isoform X2 [Atheta coriaria]|uniref:anoctamin-5 isoform X2 n=1 Tax=Dalotia coriaria TaxID=877792 RepID=UPI0031F3BF10